MNNSPNESGPEKILTEEELARQALGFEEMDEGEDDSVDPLIKEVRKQIKEAKGDDRKVWEDFLNSGPDGKNYGKES